MYGKLGYTTENQLKLERGPLKLYNFTNSVLEVAFIANNQLRFKEFLAKHYNLD